MSTVSSLSSSNVSVYSPTTTRASSVSAPDGDGDNDGGRVHHGHRGKGPEGGGMAQQLMAALQSLGLTAPGTSSASSNSSSSSSSTSSDSSSSSTDATGKSTLRKDMHEFMHQLFDAARQAESSSSSTSTSADAGKNGFSQGLAAVLAEVNGGNAPSGLQSAFDQLKSDLTASSGTSSSSVTLQDLLGKLQSNVGYSGTSTTTAASGIAVNTVA